jgi:hypothetical protein
MEVKPVKKLISLLLALVILCGSAANAAPIAAAAERPENVYQTEEEAVAKICEYLMARTETFTVSLASTSGDGKALSQRLMQAAMAHTGDPRQGDFLTWQMSGWSASITTWQIGSTYEHKIAIQVQFYTTAAQEAALDKAVADVLLQLDLGAKSDYEKIRGVYDYICDNVVYDHANLNDGDYYLKYTAYAALVNKTSVCQGYALLMYRLLLELGVDNRIIAGRSSDQNHAWNIVQLDGKYYNLDATWDAGREPYHYFLCCQSHFDDHDRNDEYDTEGFHTLYPMSATDYSTDPCANGHTPVTDPQKEPGCTTTGLTAGCHCQICGHVITAQQTVPAKGHSYGAWTVVREATVDADGLSQHICGRCGHTEAKTIPKLEETQSQTKPTEPPDTEPPATEPPVTEPPATEPPATESPTTEPPATEPPVTDPSAPADPTDPPEATEIPATEPTEAKPIVPEPTDDPQQPAPQPEQAFDWRILVVSGIIAAVAIAVVIFVSKKKKA